MRCFAAKGLRPRLRQEGATRGARRCGQHARACRHRRPVRRASTEQRAGRAAGPGCAPARPPQVVHCNQAGAPLSKHSLQNTHERGCGGGGGGGAPAARLIQVVFGQPIPKGDARVVRRVHRPPPLLAGAAACTLGAQLGAQSVRTVTGKHGCWAAQAIRNAGSGSARNATQHKCSAPGASHAGQALSRAWACSVGLAGRGLRRLSKQVAAPATRAHLLCQVSCGWTAGRADMSERWMKLGRHLPAWRSYSLGDTTMRRRPSFSARDVHTGQ